MENQKYSQNNSDINVLIEQNMDLVRRIAWHFSGRIKSAVEIDDLIQIGMYGLVNAAQNYVPKDGVAFSSYASIRIRGEIVDYLRRNSNLCRTTIKMQQRFSQTVENLTKKYNRIPTQDEIADFMDLSTSELDTWQQAFAANQLHSLDDVYDEFSIWYAANEQNPEEDLKDSELRELLIKSLKNLPEKEALIIQLYYVEELNVYEIAKVMDVTTGRVSQIKKSAISKLRSFINQTEHRN